MESLGERIRSLRKKLNLGQEELCEKVSCSRQALSRWENGHQLPNSDTIAKLADTLGVSTDYLMGRTDDPAPAQDIKKEPADPKTDRLPLKDDPFFKQNVRIVHNAEKKISVPLVSRELTACCGSGIGALDITSEPEEYISWDRSEFHILDDLRPPFAIFANGDCLESDDIKSGDKIIINPAEEPAQGAIVLVSLYGMLSLKRFYKLSNNEILLRSDDGERRLSPDEQETSNFSVVGVMVGSIKKRPPTRPL